MSKRPPSSDGRALRLAVSTALALACVCLAVSVARAGEGEPEPEVQSGRASCEVPAVVEPAGSTLAAVATGLALDEWGDGCEAVGRVELRLGQAELAVFECGDASTWAGTVLVVGHDGRFWAETLGVSSIGMEELERYEVVGFELASLGRTEAGFALVLRERVEHLARQENDDGELEGFADVGGHERIRVLEVTDDGPRWLAAVKTFDPVAGTRAEVEWRHGARYEVVAPEGTKPSAKPGTFALGAVEHCRPASP